MSGALASDRVVLRRNGRGVHVSMDSFVDIVAETIPSPAVSWGDVSGKPATFAPSAHTQAISTVTGLQAALDGKAGPTFYVQQTRPSAAGPWQWWETDAEGNIVNLTINDGTP